MQVPSNKLELESSPLALFRDCEVVRSETGPRLLEARDSYHQGICPQIAFRACPLVYRSYNSAYEAFDGARNSGIPKPESDRFVEIRHNSPYQPLVSR